MYEICRRRDSSYDGRFFMAVITTRIFCLPSCPARMPLRKNVHFYESKPEALSDGFRGCKRCKSMEYPVAVPVWLATLENYLSDTMNRVDWEYLRLLTGMERRTLDRWYQRREGVSITQKNRRIRLTRAREMIANGTDLGRVPYRCGFNSVSGFRAAFRLEFGITPGRTEVVRND